LERALARGALAYGYPAEYWTLERVQWLIAKKFKIHYHPSGVWHVLRRLGWNCQKPQRLALQRDEATIAYWKRYRWPRIKKVADSRRHPCFSR
jgi:transposase